MTRRVVVTGLGAVTPVGNDMSTTWDGLVAGRSGIGPVTHFDASGLRTPLSGEVKDFDPTAHIDPKPLKHMDPNVQFAVVAAKEALEELAAPDLTPGGGGGHRRGQRGLSRRHSRDDGLSSAHRIVSPAPDEFKGTFPTPSISFPMIRCRSAPMSPMSAAR